MTEHNRHPMIDHIINRLLRREDAFDEEVQLGASFGREISEALKQKGFQTVEDFARSSVATYESVLENERCRVSITSASFLGVFTAISVRPLSKEQKAKAAKEEPFYVTTFCNFAHRLSDGTPIRHECYTLSPTKLRLERDFDCKCIEGSMKDFYPGEKKALNKGDARALDEIFWKHAPVLTLSDLNAELNRLHHNSPLGRQTVVCVCLAGSGVEYLQPKRVRLECDDSGGALIVLDVFEHNLGDKEQ